MKKLKFILIGAISLLATSCLVDDEDSTNAQGLYDSPNIANFTENTINLILTPASPTQEYSTRVNYSTDLPISTGASFRYAVNTTETTIAASDYEIETSADHIFSIPAGTEVANGYFDYKIIPDNIPTGVTSYFVVDLIKTSGAGNVVGGKLVITINKCDPPLSGDYTVGNYNEPDSPGYTAPNGTINTIGALDCDNNYRVNRLEPFGTDYWWTFNHDTVTNAITITDFQFQANNPLTGSGTYDPVTNTLSFSGMTVGGVAWYYDVSFDIVLN